MTAGNWGPPTRSPWADPATPTEPGPPYAGPPPTAQPYGAYQPGRPYGSGPYGYAAPYGPPAPWGAVPPRPPQRPGQVITAAVLAFAQAAVVLIASLYLWFFASLADLAAAEAEAEADGVYSPGMIDALAAEGTVLAVVQVLSSVVLVGAGVRALTSRRQGTWRLLVAALAVQVALAGYWAVRLLSEIGGFDTEGAILAFSLFFAAGPLVGLGMLLVGPGRRWFGGTAPA